MSRTAACATCETSVYRYDPELLELIHEFDIKVIQPLVMTTTQPIAAAVEMMTKEG